MTTAIKVTPAGEITTIHVAELADYQREIGGWIAELRLTNGHALLVDEEAGVKNTEPNLLASLYLTQNFDGAMQAIAKDCPVAVLTRSAAGCVVVDNHRIHATPAYPVNKVVDVTGAGDLFAAGFLFGYTNGKSVAQSAQLGALAAAEVISHVGARPEVNLQAHSRALGLL